MEIYFDTCHHFFFYAMCTSLWYLGPICKILKNEVIKEDTLCSAIPEDLAFLGQVVFLYLFPNRRRISYMH